MAVEAHAGTLAEAGLAHRQEVGAADGDAQAVGQGKAEAVPVPLRARHGGPRHPPAAMDLKAVGASEPGQSIAEAVMDQRLAAIGIDAQIMVLRRERDQRASLGGRQG